MEIDEIDLLDTTSDEEFLDDEQSSEYDFDERLDEVVIQERNLIDQPSTSKGIQTKKFQKELPTIAKRKLKNHVALRLIQRAKKSRKKNYFFISNPKVYVSVDKTKSTSLKEIPIEISDSEEVIYSTTPQNETTLSKLEDSRSLKINKVVTSGDLSIQRLMSLERQLEKTKKLSLVIKKKHESPGENEEKSEQKLSESLQETSSNNISDLQENSQLLDKFPKAIIYPDSKKAKDSSSKLIEPKRMSYNEVFTKATQEKIKSLEQKNNDCSKKISSTKSKIHEKASSKAAETQKFNLDTETTDDNAIEENEPKPFKYLIPQNLIASDDKKVSKLSKKSQKTFSSSETGTLDTDLKDSELPERPKINNELIDALSDYRVIARYLFNRLNIPPMDFDATDDYINLYKLSRN